MSIKNVKLKNSRVGIYSHPKQEGVKVRQLVLGVWEERFLIKGKSTLCAYDITGAIVAKGKLPTDDNPNSLDRITQ